MSETPQTHAARRWSVALATVALALGAALLVSVSAARATAPTTTALPVGTYTLVTCTQPDGAPAPTNGWRTGVYGAGGNATGSGAVNTCATGGDLTATSSSSGAPAIDTGPEWTFTAPAGMTIAGGSIDATLTAPQGQAWLGTPLGTDDAGDALVSCVVGQVCGTAGTASGVFAITHPGGTAIYAPALCVDVGQTGCPAGDGAGGVNAQVAIHQAEIELDTSATPTGSDFSGSLLAGRASGTARLQFSAADPATGGGSGPGVYAVTVTIDGKKAYSGTPNTNAGKCLSLGTDPADGAQMFAYSQPCKAKEKVSVPVDTTTLPDGAHTMKVSVTDAAGDVATVLTRHFTTSNPVTTPVPAAADEVAGRFVLGWRWQGATTTLLTAGASGLPRGGTVAVQCTGRRCPSLRPASVPVAHIATLLAMLRHRSFHAGDRLYVTVAASAAPPGKGRHHQAPRPATATPEHLRLTIRKGARPGMRLVSSVPPAG